MSKIVNKKKIKALIFLFTMTYMVSYMTRINFGAIITEIVEQTGMTKTMLSYAVTGSAITYGVGQLISGYIGDRVSPKRLVFLGLLVTSCMNFLMPFCTSYIQMTVVWCFNGIAQAFMWPPMVKLMVGLFSESEYKRASTMVNWGGAFGTIAIYLSAPVVIMLFSWRALFGATALLGISMAILWQKFCYEPSFEKVPKQVQKISGEQKASVAIDPLALAIMFAIVLQGALRDGVTTWMPSYISETYHLSSEISILTGVFLPVFSIVCLRVALALYEKLPGNPVRCATIIFAVGACAALILTMVSGNNAIFSVVCSALLTGSMNGVNLMLISMVPPFFQKHGNISTVSGLLNSCTYVGSAISTYGIALLSESAGGWKLTEFIWFLIATLGTVICFLCNRVWKEKMR